MPRRLCFSTVLTFTKIRNTPTKIPLENISCDSFMNDFYFQLDFSTQLNALIKHTRVLIESLQCSIINKNHLAIENNKISVK